MKVLLISVFLVVNVSHAENFFSKLKKQIVKPKAQESKPVPPQVTKPVDLPKEESIASKITNKFNQDCLVTLKNKGDTEDTSKKICGCVVYDMNESKAIDKIINDSIDKKTNKSDEKIMLQKLTDYFNSPDLDKTIKKCNLTNAKDWNGLLTPEAKLGMINNCKDGYVKGGGNENQGLMKCYCIIDKMEKDGVIKKLVESSVDKNTNTVNEAALNLKFIEFTSTNESKEINKKCSEGNSEIKHEPRYTQAAIGVQGYLNDVQIFGGTSYDVYLGCLTCNKFDSSSVHNEFGSYGSKFSSTSVFNQFGNYGSQFSDESSCNKFANTPPALVSKDGKFLGYLTLNQYKTNAIKEYKVLNWLNWVVCKK